ncbi:glycosyltransferase family 4 protein [Cerasicoccus frondis]|uniref:glycosyltransferase family 4 protein n=1 Tax=Cerasicoccus frondis TaxID=490090 RepID=UPI002852D38F|nr:glycosyltransferase family 4 protein [Cerasicoccus frondis]
MKHIVFYDDNPDFGGHQFMAMRGVAAANRRPEFKTTLVLNPKNERLFAHTEAIQKAGGKLEVRYSPAVTKKFQALRNHVNGKSFDDLVRLFAELAPDLIVCLQGEIEDSSMALLAAKKSEHRVMSYIPVAHTMEQMGAKLGALRDLTTGYLFRAPDSWMTISQCIADMLRDRGATAPIHIVENGIDTERFTPRDAAQLRQEQGLPDGLLFGVCGRVEFNQKQQEFLVRAMSRWSGELAAAKLLIVGDGPDYARLQNIITEVGLTERIILRAWEKHPETLYPALDCLIIPSRFEGFPLVMLEAAACGVPVVGSDNDGMHDFLPTEWRFPQGSEEGLVRALKSITVGSGELVRKQRQRVLENHTLQQFEDRFVETLLRELP